MTIRRLATVLAADVVAFSARMERDEAGTLQRMKELQRDIVQPRALEHGGRLVKTTGDGFLVEFSSPSEALRSALEVQQQIRSQNDDLRLRIGINLGDILVEEDGDLYGDDVNIAARLQALADPGGIIVSGKVFDEVEGQAICTFEARGKQQLKNISRPVRIYAVTSPEAPKGLRSVDLAGLKQDIRYCRSQGGVRLAWAAIGQGPPIVKAANWLSHLEYDWQSPLWHHLYEGLARDHTLIRYDARGNGLSDWEVPEVSLEAFVSDLEAVVDAAGLGRFPLLGLSQGAAVSIAYAVRHPERVSHLILYGGFAVCPLKRSPEERQKREAFITLVRIGWDDQDSTARDLFVSQLIPDGTPEQRRVFAEQQRMTTSGACAARYLEAVGNFDVRDLLGQVEVPTLVMHTRGDILNPVELGRDLAAGIRGARFVVFPGRNHVIPEDDPAAERFFEEVRLFLREERLGQG
jgi:class 3 adenylate cyclase/pimeloyl-ACP methyl ester carboxylesterase